ncbi:capsular polysaccharide biosynthesis protein [Alkalibaculum bacchi]|uniref:Capsular polysaccharide biosynthesis protein n=1 Tax=Alkalibaculum bacchi TaxID=645887 RepID=A0A366IHT2_9FIRM|nr:Wzz/FepE/Etk N-terminal domain-containing protein [Alkalibaculum bacchi]RBP70219.1 capsular polysaccharide biosynthesis protein [Alkalibaculum bacchi]
MEQYESAEELDLKELWFVFKNNIKFIAIMVLLAMIVTSIVTFFVLDKEYESYTTLMLGKPKEYEQERADITYNDVMLNQQLVSTYGEIVKSKTITNQVIDNLQLDISSAQLSEMATVTTLNDTEIIKITVRNTDPVLAATIANEMANVFMDYVSELMNIDNVNIIDVAEANNTPVAPRSMMNIAISFVLGLMIGVFIVFIREYLNTKISTSKQVEAIIDYPILAIIPEFK